ncbi:hypothetical protein ACFFQW_12705 [Umezawaea endophytica]|uniref:HAF family extracellular repeat protein n=1 Tax=Umezawaea endophytica TaxID=1654476 RepID=A0A9X3AFI2_9PSEU|nr:hypothetical protein [Umezawaea endophytica]MCS7477225.1 hypothetical protein [Umezawaea endophytica]
MRFRYPVVVALALATIVSPTASAAACTWTPTVLPLPSGLTQGTVYAADSQSGYAGTAQVSSGTVHAVRWVGGQAVDYGTVPGYSHAFVAGVNKSGVIVGHTSATTGNRQRAFRSVGTTLQVLPEPAGAQHTWANGVNDAGDIVGEMGVNVTSGSTTNLVRTAVLWPASAPGTVVKLTGGLPTGGQTLGEAVDQDGSVLVEYYPGAATLDATALYVWKAGAARKLPVPAFTEKVVGRAISNGRVAGGIGNGDLVAAVWEADGTLVRPADSDLVVSINKTGQTTGWKIGTGLSQTWSVWQGTAKVGTISGQRALNVSADNGTVAGYSWNSTTFTQPTYWRCS